MAASANPVTVRKGQKGTVFRPTIRDDEDDSIVDVSGATTKEVRAKKPDGTQIEKAASFTTDGTDGQIEVQDDAGEFTDQNGNWTFWGYVVLPGGFDGDSDVLEYTVKAVGAS